MSTASHWAEGVTFISSRSQRVSNPKIYKYNCLLLNAEKKQPKFMSFGHSFLLVLKVTKHRQS